MPRETAQVQQLLTAIGETATTEDEVAAMLAQLPPAERAQAEAQLQQWAQQLANMNQAEKAQLVLLSQIREAVNQANAAEARGLLPNAIAHQQAAIHHARRLAQQTNAREAWVQLSVLLYNLAGYHSRAGQQKAAVACLEEVVALDERTGHPDLASDRAALRRRRRRWLNRLPPPPTKPN
ncbi:MAG: hypothetical protein Fur0021_34690 [Candidatus Promineifilaceae bacterium]